jgi:hypothetical protein
MDQSAHNQVESIVRSLEEKGIPAAPVVEAIALATSHPEAVSDLAVAVMENTDSHPLPHGPRIHSFAAGKFGAKPRPLVVSNADKASVNAPQKTGV